MTGSGSAGANSGVETLDELLFSIFAEIFVVDIAGAVQLIAKIKIKITVNNSSIVLIWGNNIGRSIKGFSCFQIKKSVSVVIGIVNFH